LYGKPVIKGTRVPVDLILEKLSEGESINELLKSYPQISVEAISACLNFASQFIRNEDAYPIAS